MFKFKVQRSNHDSTASIDLFNTDLKKDRDQLLKIVARRNEELFQINQLLEKQVESRQKSEYKARLMEQALENIDIGVTICDNDKKIIYVNKAEADMHGYTVDELIGQNVRIFSTSEKWHDMDNEAMSQAGTMKRESTNLRKDGSSFSVQLISCPVRNPDDLPIGMITVCEDITRKKTDEVNRRRLSMAIENVDESVMITNPSGEILYVNPAFEKITGFSSEEAIGQKPSLIKSGQHSDDFYNGMWSTIKHGQSWHGHLVNRKKDASFFEAECTISPIKDEKNQISNFVAVTRDVTEKTKLEKHLRQSQKLEAIGTLAGGIAHDFNNILSAIIGYSELSLEVSPKEGKVPDNLNRVLKAANRAKNMINQILAFSRQSEQKREPVELTGIVNETLKLLRSSLPSTIIIKQKIEKNLDNVMADPTQMHQVLMNLCTNASHAMQKGGGVMEISLSQMELRKNSLLITPNLAPGQYLRLTVCDNGIGMDEEMLERIFEPFFTSKQKGKGTGMGLAVVQGIVKSHGGDIRVVSKPGKGSTFDILFPAIKDIQRVEERDCTPIPGGDEHILIVDDDEDLTIMYREILEGLGYKIVAKTTSIEAWNTFRENPDRFDLVITDLTIPIMTGIDLAKELMKIQPDLPVILITGFSESITPEEAKKIGFREFILKPIEKESLARIIRTILDSSKYRASST